jgi:polysaccharide export outer membrane protein
MGLRATWVLLSAAVAACAPAMPAVPATPDDDAPFVQAAVVQPGLDESAAEPPDTLSSGDVLAARFTGSPELDQPQTTLDRSGRIHLPLLGDLDIAGRTLTEAEAVIQAELQKYEKFTRVSLTLVDGRGRFATVTGAVERPGNVPLVGDARVADVLAAVGGPRFATTEDRFVPIGDVDGARVVRNGVALPVDVRRAMAGDRRHNVRIRTRDVLYVPPALTSRIAVLGNVDRPRTVAYYPGMRLTEALAYAGGLHRNADAEDVRVIRGGYRNPRIYATSIKELFAGVRPDVVLAPGDIVYISEHWFATVGGVLERIIPAAATYFLYQNLQQRDQQR